VAVLVEKDIFWLEVSVCDPVRVEVGKCEHKLCSVESSPSLRNAFHALKVVEKLAASTVVEHKIQLAVGLEGEMHLGNVRVVVQMAHYLKHPPFCACVLDLLSFHHCGLGQYFHSV
jgi:hypothetical protein